MPRVSKQALVPYSCEQMYAIVNDVEAYPDFLHWCERSVVHERTEDRLAATLTLARGPIRQTFSTVNRMVPDREVRLELGEGPFRYLSGLWRFEPVADEGCRIAMNLEFEFKSRIINRTFGPVFNPISNSLVDAFCRRARELHG